MPTKVLSVGTTEAEAVEYNDRRTALTIQNLHASNVVYVTDSSGQASVSGLALGTQYSSITLRRSEGYEPQKQWFVYASGASTPVRILEMFGELPTEPGPPGVPGQPFVDPPIRRMR